MTAEKLLGDYSRMLLQEQLELRRSLCNLRIDFDDSLVGTVLPERAYLCRFMSREAHPP